MRVCVVKDHDIQLTETFIRAHAADLGANIICGQPLRLMGPNQRKVPVPVELSGRIWRRLKARGGEFLAPTLEYVLLLKAARAEVVLAEYGTTGAGLWRACQISNLPLVVHFHGYDASRGAVIRKYGERYREMFEYASAIIVVSRAMRERVIELGAPPDKIVLNPCSVDLETFALGAPDQAPPSFLAVGRLVEKKAPHLLVLAFAEVHRQLPEATLRIVGEGSLMSVARDLVAGLGLGDAVTLLGAQPHDVVRDEMRRARAFVQHSVVASNGDSEGTPVSVLEAAASGLPVVSTEHAGIPDAVSDGVTGYTVPERDVAGMAARMLEVARDPALAADLGRAGRQRVAALYSQELRTGRLRETVRCAYEGRPLDPSLRRDPIDDDYDNHRMSLPPSAQ